MDIDIERYSKSIMTITCQIGLAVIVSVSILASGTLFTFNSTDDITNVTAEIAERQHTMENPFNNTDSISSSSPASSSSQISPYAGQELRDLKSLSDNDIQSLQNLSLLSGIWIEGLLTRQ